jgi:hypothetical protein
LTQAAGREVILSRAESQLSMRQVNAKRATLSGINSRPLPSGGITLSPDGTRTLAAKGSNYLVRSDGTLASYAHGSTQATFRPDGTFRSVRRAGMEIDHSVHGQRRVVTTQPNGGRVVSFGPGRGFVERPIVRNGKPYAQRTYLVNQLTYTRLYRTYTYQGTVIAEYVPTVYYPPAFYGWASSPWPTPVAYRWTWASEPWYGSYGTYFAPYPAYSSSGMWLTDFFLAESLRQAYQERPAGEAYSNSTGQSFATSSGTHPGPSSPASGPISPETKQLVGDQIQNYIKLEHAAVANPGAATDGQGSPLGERALAVLDPSIKLFFVSGSVEVTTSGDQECSLDSGDILMRGQTVENGATAATLTVIQSKTGECAKNAQVRVSVADLEEMNNHFCEHVDDALQTLAADQGKNGLPSTPDATGRSSPEAQLLASADTSSVGLTLQQQDQRAAEAEQKIQQEALPQERGSN